MVGRQPIVAHISKELAEVRSMFKNYSDALRGKLDSILKLQEDRNALMERQLKFEMFKAGVSAGKC